MKNNVPFDVAFSLEPDMLLSMCIIMGEYEGNDFDFERMRWKERPT